MKAGEIMKYESPAMEIVLFEIIDVVTVSVMVPDLPETWLPAPVE